MDLIEMPYEPYTQVYKLFKHKHLASRGFLKTVVHAQNVKKSMKGDWRPQKPPVKPYNNPIKSQLC